MTALDLIREKKRKGLPLTALEMVIWEAYWKGNDSDNAEQIALAETAANELQDLNERAKGHLR